MRFSNSKLNVIDEVISTRSTFRVRIKFDSQKWCFNNIQEALLKAIQLPPLICICSNSMEICIHIHSNIHSKKYQCSPKYKVRLEVIYSGNNTKKLWTRDNITYKMIWINLLISHRSETIIIFKNNARK